MLLQKLNFVGFRNLDGQYIEPATGFNVIWGDNAQGKTNILEAINLLSQLKSFRTSSRESLINNQSEFARLAAGISIGDVYNRLTITLSREGKSASFNGKRINNDGDILGRLKTVLFAPEEISLVRGNPAGRRALLDRAVFQSNTGFLHEARDYQRCLKQRNRLLKDKAAEKELKPWTEKLIISGARLRRARFEFIDRLRPLLEKCYSEICQGQEIIDLGFSPRVSDEPENIAADMARVAVRERQYQQTLAGPHRDDLLFLLDGRSLRQYGSQGQQRSFMLAFKSAQVMDTEQQTGSTPVLLLDDLTSELDSRRRQAFFDFLLARRGQVFLTTTDARSLGERGLDSARYFHVEAGHIHADIEG